MSAPAIPRIGIPHGPFGPADLRSLKIASTGVCQPVLLFRADTAVEERDLISAASRLLEAHVVAREELSDVAARHRLDGVAFLHDRGLDYAEAIAEAAGFRTGGLGPSTWDKFTQRRVLRDAGLSSVDCRAVNSRHDFETASSLLGAGVLKPRRGDSSNGVRLVRGTDEARSLSAATHHWDNLTFEGAIPSGAHPSADGLGDYVSVECVSGEDHRPVAVFDKLPAFRPGGGGAVHGAVVESGHVFPSSLPASVQRRLLAFIVSCLDALRIRHHVTHTEVRILGDEFEVIEVNGRPGGYVTPLLKAHAGVDLVAAALGLAAGAPADSLVPADIVTPTCFSAYVLPTFADDSDVVESNVDIRSLRSIAGVDRVAGLATQGRPRSATGHRAAAVRVQADSLPELLRIADEVHQRAAAAFSSDTLLG
jgi:hypothetical protein